jgi:3D (Asp-Asp-Asp) domain-containing protein
MNLKKGCKFLILLIMWKITAYCSCPICCGKWADGITASGKKATWGMCAADLPFGTMVEIKGIGTFTVEDRGGAIKGNRIDIWFPSHQEALEFGVKYCEVSILNQKEKQ